MNRVDRIEMSTVVSELETRRARALRRGKSRDRARAAAFREAIELIQSAISRATSTNPGR